MKHILIKIYLASKDKIKTSHKRQANLRLNWVGSTKAVLEPRGMGTATYGLHRYVRLE